MVDDPKADPPVVDKDKDKDKQTPPVTPPEEPPKDPPKDQADKDEVETITLSKEDFTDLQLKIVNLQTKVEKSEKEKVKMDRDQKFTELKKLNPKLAELNKNAVSSTLDTVIETAKTLKGQFPSISDGDDKPVKKAQVGYRKLNDKEWITDNLT